MALGSPADGAGELSRPFAGVSDAALFAGLVDADIAIAKAIEAPELTQSLAVEVRYRDALISAFLRRARAAVVAAEVLAGEEDAEDLPAAVERACARAFAGLQREVEPIAAKAMRELYRLGRQAAWRKAAGLFTGSLVFDDVPVKKAKSGPKKGSQRIEIKPTFDLVDADAVESLTNHQVFWVGQHYTRNLSDRVAEVTRSVIVEGGQGERTAARSLGEALEKEFGLKGGAFERPEGIEIPAGWKGSTQDYFQGVATNAATTARVAGSVRSLEQLGVTRYEFVNPMDDRTSVICRELHGKTFEVKAAADRWRQILAAESPDAIRDNLHAWRSPKDAWETIGWKPGEKWTPEVEKKAAAAGFSFPPLHFHCRSTVDISEDAELLPLEDEDAVFPWSESELKTRPDIEADGMHPKDHYESPDGAVWMFKPVGRGEEFRAQLDRAMVDLARDVGIEAPDVYVTTVGGRTGSIHKLWDVNGSLKGAALDGLNERDVEYMQQQHVWSWFTSEHDPHRKNLIRLRESGELRHIDWGQSFRFFGKDQLSTSYNPNPDPSVFNELFDLYAQGQTPYELAGPASQKKLAELIDRIEALPDEVLVQRLAAYAKGAREARAGAFSTMDEAAFFQAVAQRKRDLRKQMTEFYADLNKRRAAALKAAARRAAPRAVVKVDDKLVKAAEEAQWAGRAMLLGGPDFEDMQALVYRTHGDAGRLLVEGKLRASADARIYERLKKAVGETPAAAADAYWPRVQTVAKSFNAHLNPKHSQYDGKIPEKTAKAWDEIVAELRKLKRKSKIGTPERALADHHLAYLEAIRGKDGEWNQQGIGRLAAAWEPPPVEAAKPAAVGPFKVRKVKAFYGERAIVSGEVRDVAPDRDPSFSRALGEVYEVTWEDGTRLRYVPHNEAVGNAYSKLGKFRLSAPEGTSSGADLDAARRKLVDLGLEIRDATEIDVEVLYLRKVAAARFRDLPDAFDIPEDLPPAEQLEKLRTAWNEELRVKDVTKLAGYKPELSGTYGEGKGWQVFTDRFDVADADVEKYELRHSTSGTISSVLDQMLETKTKAVLATEERIRVGVYADGMSSGADQGTGGASYVFTRVREKGSGGTGLFFDGRLLKNPDAIIYTGDRFGNVHPDELKSGRQRLGAGVSPLPDIAARNASDETIFKHAISLDRVTRIVAGSANERDAVLAVFRKHGIEKLGGKKIESIVKVK